MNNLNLTNSFTILGLEKSILEEKIIDFGLPKFRQVKFGIGYQTWCKKYLG